MRAFIITTEITVEDERPKTDGWFREITAVVKSRKIVYSFSSLYLYAFILMITLSNSILIAYKLR